MAPYSIPNKEEMKSVQSAAKVMVTVLWDEQGVILANF